MTYARSGATEKRRRIEPVKPNKSFSGASTLVLPEVIHREISSYLTFEDLLASSRVNQQWRSYARKALTLKPPVGVYKTSMRNPAIEVLLDPKLDSNCAKRILGFNIIACAKEPNINSLKNALNNKTIFFSSKRGCLFSSSSPLADDHFDKINWEDGICSYFPDNQKNLLCLILQYSSLLTFPSSFLQTCMLDHANKTTDHTYGFVSYIVQNGNSKYLQLLFDVGDFELRDDLYTEIFKLQNPKTVFDQIKCDWRESRIYTDSSQFWFFLESMIEDKIRLKGFLGLFSSADQVGDFFDHPNEEGNFEFLVKSVEKDGLLHKDDVEALFKFFLLDSEEIPYLFSFVQKVISCPSEDQYVNFVPFLNFFRENLQYTQQANGGAPMRTGQSSIQQFLGVDL